MNERAGTPKATKEQLDKLKEYEIPIGRFPGLTKNGADTLIQLCFNCEFHAKERRRIATMYDELGQERNMLVRILSRYESAVSRYIDGDMDRKKLMREIIETRITDFYTFGDGKP